MSVPTIGGKIQLTKNNNIDALGVAVAPSASDLQYGQLAINYNFADPALFFKTYDEVSKTDKVVKIVTEEVIADTLVDILGGSAAELSTLKELLAAFQASDIATTQASILTRLSSAESGKVDKVAGKGLSTNDYTTTEKNKLSGIAAGAQVNTVTSVAGKTGPVTLLPSDCGALAVDGKAADSAKLDGKPSSSYYGVLTKPSTDTIKFDANTAPLNVLTHDYRWDNTPYNSSVASLLDISYNAASRSQLYFKHNDIPIVGIRGMTGSTWKNWYYLYHSGNFNNDKIPFTASNIDIAINGYLKFSASNEGAQWAVREVSSNGNLEFCTRSGEEAYVPRLRMNFFTGEASINNNIVYHAGNSNLSTVDWTCRDFSAINAKVSNTVASCFTIERTNTDYNNCIHFKGQTKSVYLGVSDGVLKFGDTSDVKDLGFTVYHAGNSNKTDANWKANFLDCNKVRLLRTTGVSAGEIYMADAETMTFKNGSGGSVINFLTNNGTDIAERLRIHSNGNVGIGTSTPSDELHIFKNEAKLISSKIQNSVGSLSTGVDSDGSGFLWHISDKPLRFATGNIERFRVSNNGNIGIGTTTPEAKLDINGSFIARGATRSRITGAKEDIGLDLHTESGNYTAIRFFKGTEPTGVLHAFNGLSGTTGKTMNLHGDDYVTLGAWQTPELTVDVVGKKVGIGTKTPTEKLDVNGNININGYAISGTTNFGAAGFIGGLKHYSLRKCGIAPDGKQFVILIGEIGTAEKRDKTYVNGKFIIERGTPSAWNNSNNWDILMADAYTGTVGDLKTCGTGTSGEIGTCTNNGKRYVAVRLLGTASTCDIVFSGMASGNCAFTVTTMDTCTDWVKVESSPSKIKGLLECESSVNVGGNVTAKGDVVAYSAVSNVRIEPAAGASALFDLTDVELPADLTNANNFVLAYDVTKKKWTAKESAGTGGAPVDYARLSNVPTTFMPCVHNHEETAYISDSRLKTDIAEIPNALNTILNLKGRKYKWSDQAINEFDMKDEYSFGYIAQDVQEIIPEIVKKLKNSEEFVGVEYIKVIPFITEAIKEIHGNMAQNNRTLLKEISNLKRMYAELKNSIK